MQIRGMDIESVQEDETCYIVTLAGGEDQGASVPKDPRNSDYQAVQVWIEAGGVTTPVPPLPE